MLSLVLPSLDRTRRLILPADDLSVSLLSFKVLVVFAARNTLVLSGREEVV